MKVSLLYKSLTAQLALLFVAFILLAAWQLAFGWTLRFASEADLLSETQRAVVDKLYVALDKGPKALENVAQSSLIKKVAQANPNFRYYVQSQDGKASFGGEPRLTSHPELLNILEDTVRNAFQEPSGRKADASKCNLFFGGGNAWLPFVENGVIGNIIYSNCRDSKIYVEIAGIENAAVSRTDLLWSQLRILSFASVRDYIFLSCGLLLMISFIFYRAWASLHRVARLTDSIDFDKSSTQLSEKGLPLEVRPLVRAVNAMLRRIDESVERQRFFLATAAHELRTPLTILRARLEEAPESDVKAPMRNDIKRMSGLVDSMLSLMKLKSGASMTLGEVDLAHVARDVCAARAPIAIDRGVEIEFNDAASAVPVTGNAQMISTAISNILDNAISVSACGDTVAVSISDGRCIEVRDHGPGLPCEKNASIFEPFSKFPPNRNGHGLGLAIVAEIMALHHGHAEAKNAPEGGAIFQLRFN